MDTLLEAIREFVRKFMRRIAHTLNWFSGGRISPNAVTIIGLLAHVPIAWLIAREHTLLAAVLLVVFGLFDTLDGELARLQKRATHTGMLLDSVTDRMKEIIIYIGIGYLFVAANVPFFAVWAIAAIGGSVLVSYINAWGEVVLSHAGKARSTVNKAFRGGIMRFEIRITLLVVALAFNKLGYIVIVIAVLAWFTALQRLLLITKRLADVQN